MGLGGRATDNVYRVVEDALTKMQSPLGRGERKVKEVEVLLSKHRLSLIPMGHVRN